MGKKNPYPATVTTNRFPVQMHINKELQDLITPLSDDERARLEVSLVDEGCRDPIVIGLIADQGSPRNTIVDGHNRFEICARRNIPFRTVDLKFPSLDAAKLWILNNQIARRNLTDMQRAELALKMKPIFEAQAKANQKGGQGGVLLPQNSAEAIETRKKVAEAAGVSHDTIRKVETIVNRAAPAVLKLAREGKVSINAAASVAALPKKEQTALASRGPAAVKAAPKAAPVAAANPSLPPRVQTAFVDGATFDRAKQQLAALAATLRQLTGNGEDVGASPAGHHLSTQRQEIERDLKHMRDALRFCRPFQVCPYCMGKSASCVGCKGLGWVCEQAWDDAPPEKRAAVGEAVTTADDRPEWERILPDIEGVQTDLRRVAGRLSEVLQFEDKRPTRPGGYYFSYAGTVGAIYQLVRHLRDYSPGGPSDKPPGYIPHHSAEARREHKGAA